jgi:hypothetical protein
MSATIKKPRMTSKLSLLSISLFLICHLSVAQQLSIPTSFQKETDTSRTYKWLKYEVKKLKINDLTKTSDELYFRFWMKGQIIEVWTKDMVRFQGKLISYTTRYDPDRYRKPKRREKIYSKYTNIDSTISKLIYEQATSISLFDIPDQNHIKKWKQGTDGYGLSIEFATPLRYSMRYYWSPDLQLGIPEAVAIDNFNKFLTATLATRDKYNYFIQGLPKGCYNNGGILVICNGRKKGRESF